MPQTGNITKKKAAPAACLRNREFQPSIDRFSSLGSVDIDEVCCIGYVIFAALKEPLIDFHLSFV